MLHTTTRNVSTVHVYVHASMHAWKNFLYVFVSECVYVCVCMHIHTRTYTYTHIIRQSRKSPYKIHKHMHIRIYKQVMWFNKSAEQFQPDGMYATAMIRQVGYGGVPMDLKKVCARACMCVYMYFAYTERGLHVFVCTYVCVCVL
jgi:hypothetical protein